MKLSYIFLKKVFHIYRKIELSSPKNKKFQEETFHAQKIKTPTFENFLAFWEMEL